ncbi:MAG TPA: hypothetical protein VF707_04635 [Ardenticatenaceae bacterium]|jgi:hypothetical protein
MAADLEKLQQDLMALPPQEQPTRLARWLLDRAVDNLEASNRGEQSSANGLLALAGRFSGGPGDTAERAEEILEAGPQ